MIKINIFIFLLFLLLVFIECLADLCFYKTINSKTKNQKYYFIGLIMYLFIGIIYYKILEKYDNIAVPSAIYQCMSVLAVTIMSYFFLKQKISIIKLIGIFIIIIGIFLVQI